MKKHLLATLIIGVVLCVSITCSSSATAEKTVIRTYDWNSLEELVSSMTLAEKIGQMTQAERRDVFKGETAQYALGSILSGGGSAPAYNTPEGWVSMINGFIEESLESRLGIPAIYGIDAVHGNSNVQDATILPHNVGLGAIAAGNMKKGTDAAFTAGRITAEEMLAAGIRWTFAPVLGVAEDVRWGRTYESFSENVDIVTLMGASFIKGLQSSGAAACIKHYLGEGQAENGQNKGNAVLDRDEIERILPPYRAAINAGAMSLMASFSSVNDIKMHEHKELLTDILKGELGFKGFVISDWAGIQELPGDSYKEKIGRSVNAGIDMIMAAGARNNWLELIKYLQELAEEGTVPMERIDDAVLRILRFKQSIGLFDNPLVQKAGNAGSKENRSASRLLVSDSLVLLRNQNNILSHLPFFKNILVAGEGANDIGMQCGGWTITWQGEHGPITKGTTVLEGIQKAKGKTAVTYSPEGIAKGRFDAVIAVIGESPYAETDGDRFEDINIRETDMLMLQEVYKYNCPVIVIMLSGRPMTIGDEFEKWDAFIAAWLPGSEGGGIADVLFGKRNFTGKTPYTWRKTINGEIIYPFGFGLEK